MSKVAYKIIGSDGEDDSPYLILYAKNGGSSLNTDRLFIETVRTAPTLTDAIATLIGFRLASGCEETRSGRVFEVDFNLVPCEYMISAWIAGDFVDGLMPDPELIFFTLYRGQPPEIELGNGKTINPDALPRILGAKRKSERKPRTKL